jgi:hypothetical protein
MNDFGCFEVSEEKDRSRRLLPRRGWELFIFLASVAVKWLLLADHS